MLIATYTEANQLQNSCIIHYPTATVPVATAHV